MAQFELLFNFGFVENCWTLIFCLEILWSHCLCKRINCCLWNFVFKSVNNCVIVVVKRLDKMIE
jgi:hypothetical protein